MARLTGERLRAEVRALGAELQRLQDANGRDLLWHGDPRWWNGRAPLLFPIVGKVPDDQVMINGQRFGLPKHGFARTVEFACVDQHDVAVTFELRSSEATRAMYPFEFMLRVTYRLEGAMLSTRAVVTNTGVLPMPVSFGYHPAFLWPVPGDGRRDAYEIVFERDEPAPIRALDSELIILDVKPSPVIGRRLMLHDGLFADGALIFTELNSRSVTYGVEGRPLLRVDFPDMPQLGIWTKPGAPYVCIEPWCGYAAPLGYSGELADKPGTVSVAPGAARTFSLDITVL